MLFLPFSVKKVEHNLEAFLFLMGIAAASISGMMNRDLIGKALVDPINITLAVLIAGYCVNGHRVRWKDHFILEQSSDTADFPCINRHSFRTSLQYHYGNYCGYCASDYRECTAVRPKSEIRFTILCCFAIGLGAVLTPIGEPLSTITVSKLNEDFFYLLNLIGWEVIIGVVTFALISIFFVKPRESSDGLDSGQTAESYKEIIIRSAKIYLFVMGLTFLGHGFEPLIEKYILGLDPMLLYWINMISAILDNATLAAPE